MRRVFLIAAVAGLIVGATGAVARGGSSSSGNGNNLGGDCIAHRPNYVEGVIDVQYTQGCSGHDEPELFPISDNAGSARELTWTVVLPKDGPNALVTATGPTFWFGGTVTDPRSLFGQAFVELQFYPDAITTSCSQNGGFELKFAPNTYTACSPVWTLTSTGQKDTFHEPPAMNAMLTNGTKPGVPLVMHGGDTITIHWYTTAAKDGYHVTVTDLVTGGSGTIVLNSNADGPLMPAYDTQTVGNSLKWGIVSDAPNSFVWEIGHTSPFVRPVTKICFPGQPGCESYNASSWAATTPIVIESVKFGDGSAPQHWGVVSDYGGRAEVDQYCGPSNYGTPYCIYPWYTLGADGFRYGVNFSGTTDKLGEVDQFQQTTDCDGPFGTDTTYCSTVVK
jgi:hypothetical protein